MKKLLLLLLLLPVLASSCSEKEIIMSREDIQLRGEEPYEMAFYPFTDSRESQQTFTGKLVSHYDYPDGSSQLASETIYIDGLKDGLRGWAPNGQLLVERNWSNGRLHGLQREWYRNGQLLKESNWSEGLPHGRHQSWYENGNQRLEENYIEGRREGLYSSWNEEGNRYKEINYANGVRTGRARWWAYDDAPLVIAHYENDVVTTCEFNSRTQNGECEVNPDESTLSMP